MTRTPSTTRLWALTLLALVLSFTAVSTTSASSGETTQGQLLHRRIPSLSSASNAVTDKGAAIGKRRHSFSKGRIGLAGAAINRDPWASSATSLVGSREEKEGGRRLEKRRDTQQVGQAPSVPSPASTPAGATGAGGSATSYIPNLTRDKWIGLGLAISSSLAIGTSFIITKKGLIDAADRSTGMASDHHAYLANPIWWAGMATMIVGEVANFAAYTFAPPILVTPLGALSVLIGAILASFILKEELGRLGRVGCTLCLVGTLIIILNAPEDREITTVDEILNYAIQPGFMLYCLTVLVFAVWMIYRVVPKWGKRTPLVYISICSSVGSISVMSVKGFGVALKLTLDGNNQFTHPSTYCFAIVVVVCILVQMNYFNKALDQFSTNIVNPIYYVTFTTSTIFASFLLFQGFNTQGAAPAVSLLCGFIVIFMGVYLLNMNRLIDPVTQQPRMSLISGEGVPAGRASEHRDRFMNGEGGMFYPRLSMSQQRGPYGQLPQHDASHGHAAANGGYKRRNSNGSAGSSAFEGAGNHRKRDPSGGSSVLFNAYDESHEAMGLTRLNEHSDEDYYYEDESTLRGSSSGSNGGSGGGKGGHARTSSTGAGGERRAKAHVRSISLKLPDNLADGRTRNSPVLATASSYGSRGQATASPTKTSHTIPQAQQPAAAVKAANLLGDME